MVIQLIFYVEGGFLNSCYWHFAILCFSESVFNRGKNITSKSWQQIFLPAEEASLDLTWVLCVHTCVL